MTLPQQEDPMQRGKTFVDKEVSQTGKCQCGCNYPDHFKETSVPSPSPSTPAQGAREMFNVRQKLERIALALRRLNEGDRSGMSTQHILEIVEQCNGELEQASSRNAELENWKRQQLEVTTYRADELNADIMDFDAVKYWGKRHTDALIDIVARAKAAEAQLSSLRDERDASMRELARVSQERGHPIETDPCVYVNDEVDVPALVTTARCKECGKDSVSWRRRRAEKAESDLLVAKGIVEELVAFVGDKCGICDGTGLIERTAYDSASNAMEHNGFDKCLSCEKRRDLITRACSLGEKK